MHQEAVVMCKKSNTKRPEKNASTFNPLARFDLMALLSKSMYVLLHDRGLKTHMGNLLGRIVAFCNISQFTDGIALSAGLISFSKSLRRN